MFSKRSNQAEYHKNRQSLVEGMPTRAIVVSNKDPQFAGRVKVWIPAIHGGIRDMDEIDAEDGDTIPTLPTGVMYPGNWKEPSVQDLLPWAKCVGHNWGPRKNDFGAINISGAFSIPKVGTEVYVIFENNDPSLPIVMGAIFHGSEYTYAKHRALELIPGIEVFESSVDPNKYTPEGDLAKIDEDEYTSKAAFTYSIRGENDSMLLICDYPGESSIMLSGLIKLTDIDTLIGEKAIAVKKAYPGFPTTASAAFSKRVLLSDNAIALANPAIEYHPPFDQLKVTDEVKSTLPPPTPPADKPPTPPTNSIKQWPIRPAQGKSVPRFSDGLKNGNFGFPRPGYKNKEKKHMGLDISAAKDNSTQLLAPMDMQPLYYTVSSSAGNMLVCKAADGTGHAFMHLYSVFPSIIKIVKESPGTTVKAGTPLGYCGDTGHSFGAHLHWEIFKGAGSAKNGRELEGIRGVAQVAGTSQYFNPIEWMGMAHTPDTTVQGSPEQMRSWIDHQTMYANTNDVAYTKPIGLEISTVPGQETIYLRHPSGAFIGIDCDGNIQGYTPGDANWRVNRSWNLDVLGGILEACYAKFTRVKTVTRTWAKIFSQMKDKPDADDTYPDFFKRVQKYRKIDMMTSLRSTLGNAFYVNKDDKPMPVKDAYSDQCKGIATPPNTTKRSTDLTIYDKMISKAYSTYITGDLARVFPDWKWFKAQMLIESNGVKDARGGGSIGLFQITAIALRDVKPGWMGGDGDFLTYMDPEKNIDIAFQVMVKNYYYIKNDIMNYCNRVQGATKFDAMSAEDIRNLCFFAYNVGPGEVKDRINNIFETTLTYPAVEAAYKSVHVNNPSVKIHLQYVPTIIWLHGQ